jgi:hypothetical protein
MPVAILSRLVALPDIEGLQEWRGGVAVLGEMVFGNQAVIEAHFLRVLNLLHPFLKKGLPVSQGRVRPFVK